MSRLEDHSQQSSERLDNSRINYAMEMRGVQDADRVSVNRELHGDRTNAVEAYLKYNSNVDSVPTQDAAAAAKEFNTYKQGLVEACFDKQGNLRPDASTKDMAALHDIVNAEIASTQQRVASIFNKADQTLTVASFSGDTQLPNTMQQAQKSETRA